MGAADPALALSEPMPSDLSPRHLRRRLIQLALFAAVVAALITALPGFGAVRHRFSEIDPGYLGLIAVLELSSTLSYVVAFRGVFCPRLSWRFTYEIGMAEQGTNVLLPTGGAGGLALGAWALRQGGMPTGYIGRRSVAFFVITSLVNFFAAVVCGALLLLGSVPGAAPTAPTLVFTLGALAVMSVAAALPRLLRSLDGLTPQSRGGRILRTAAITLANGLRDAGVLLRSGRPAPLAGSVGYLGFDIGALAAAFAAFGAVPPLAPLVLAYVVGQLGGLIPLPGGIGGTDGGLIGAFVLYGTPLAQTAAAVLVYRAFQLGLPAVLGAGAFVSLRRRLSTAQQPAAMCAPLADPIEVALPKEVAA